MPWRPAGISRKTTSASDAALGIVLEGRAGMAWKGVNLGPNKVAEFQCDANGVVTARFLGTGLVFYIR